MRTTLIHGGLVAVVALVPAGCGSAVEAANLTASVSSSLSSGGAVVVGRPDPSPLPPVTELFHSGNTRHASSDVRG
ncbi:MAG: hypothetical protein JWR81_473 [Pseudonocardia sp.]|jgi:hypothetical protein|nr:hypothetical protein [Pseudonocardia sp.]MDT7614492.1 hypothetical protein [Pseudonocardiales bacterium]